MTSTACEALPSWTSAVFETLQRMTFLTRSLLWSTLGAAPKQEPSLGCPVPPYCSSPEQMQPASHAYRPVNWFHLPSLSCSTWVKSHAAYCIELLHGLSMF